MAGEGTDFRSPNSEYLNERWASEVDPHRQRNEAFDPHHPLGYKDPYADNMLGAYNAELANAKAMQGQPYVGQAVSQAGMSMAQGAMARGAGATGGGLRQRGALYGAGAQGAAGMSEAASQGGQMTGQEAIGRQQQMAGTLANRGRYEQMMRDDATRRYQSLQGLYGSEYAANAKRYAADADLGAKREGRAFELAGAVLGAGGAAGAAASDERLKDPDSLGQPDRFNTWSDRADAVRQNRHWRDKPAEWRANHGDPKGAPVYDEDRPGYTDREYNKAQDDWEKSNPQPKPGAGAGKWKDSPQSKPDYQPSGGAGGGGGAAGGKGGPSSGDAYAQADIDYENEKLMRSAKPEAWQYKPEAQQKLGLTGRTQVGPMAQSLEETPLGASVVYNTPEGKKVDTNALTMAQQGMLHTLNKRLDAVEADKGGRFMNPRELEERDRGSGEAASRRNEASKLQGRKELAGDAERRWGGKTHQTVLTPWDYQAYQKRQARAAKEAEFQRRWAERQRARDLVSRTARDARNAPAFGGDPAGQGRMFNAVTGEFE